jgi:hypothetical protein
LVVLVINYKYMYFLAPQQPIPKPKLPPTHPNPQQLNPYGMLQAGRSRNAGGIGLATKGKRQNL